MQAIMETLFDIWYLTTVITLGVLMIRQGPSGSLRRGFGTMAVVLGCGLMILRTLVSIKRSALTLINGELPADTKAREGGD